MLLNRKILLVDDNLDNLYLLNLTLKHRGYKIQESIDGNIAVSVAQEFQPDLILLDLMMPEVDGYQVCSNLKSLTCTKDIPIIFISALESEKNKTQAIAMGGVDYITKPFDLDEIIARIERQLEIRRLQQELQQQNQLLKREIEQRIQAENALKKVNQQLELLSTIDSLTGVANRRQFDLCLKDEWRRLTREKAPLSLIMLDVDYFKLYNDTYGHQAGDNCLQQVAQSISRVVKRPADLVARYGGEEFAIILPQTDLAGAVHLAHKIRVAIRYLQISHQSSSVSEYVTLSQGVTCTIPTTDSPPESLICVADLALYQAKHKGKDCIVEIETME